MGFHFKLEKVLDHRKNLENIARKNYLDALAYYQKEKDLLDSFYHAIEEARVTTHQWQTQGGESTSERLCQIHDFIKGTEIKIERQRIKVRESLEKVEEMQELLREAAIEYKMMERLKEKKKEEYRLEMKKLEEKALNEMTTARFIPLEKKNG